MSSLQPVPYCTIPFKSFRILLVTLMRIRIWILPFPLMRIRILPSTFGSGSGSYHSLFPRFWPSLIVCFSHVVFLTILDCDKWYGTAFNAWDACAGRSLAGRRSSSWISTWPAQASELLLTNGDFIIIPHSTLARTCSAYEYRYSNADKNRYSLPRKTVEKVLVGIAASSY